MIILRAFPTKQLSADEIAQYYRDWFRLSCSSSKISSSIKTILKSGWAKKIDNGDKAAYYTIVNTNTSLKSLFGECEQVLGR
tara:strand:- start:115 stop:360 length:246 start_codon:yes stop_codon:yes gene_type:complete